MPSWSINVNLTPCSTAHTCRDGHHSKCPGSPVLVPLPLEPWRSVTLTVRGKCTCHMLTRDTQWHDTDCPARPVEVACSIGGDTWDGSKPVDFEIKGRDGEPPLAIMDACRDRWALVKALVLGTWRSINMNAWQAGAMTAEQRAQVSTIVIRRDAAYAAISQVARMERAIFEAQGEYASAMDERHHPDWHRDPESYVMPSQKMLALCVQRLIEQVGVML